MAKLARRIGVGDVMSAQDPALDTAIENDDEILGVLARLEALLAPVTYGEHQLGAQDQLAQKMGGSLTWLDQRNAYIGLTKGPAALQVQVLLELRPQGCLKV